jgi:hypothetical protein
MRRAAATIRWWWYSGLSDACYEIGRAFSRAHESDWLVGRYFDAYHDWKRAQGYAMNPDNGIYERDGAGR